MRQLKVAGLFAVISIAISLSSAFTKGAECHQEEIINPLHVSENSQTINFFVTHGHCSTPFSGKAEKLSITAPARSDLGNPLEGMELTFDINPNTFTSCSREVSNDQFKTPNLFYGDQDDRIRFRSTNVYTMGLDWYQINGKLSINGQERDVKFFLSGIRDPNASNPSILVLEGQFNLLDWGIDYDQLVYGSSEVIATKWMHINMKIDLC